MLGVVVLYVISVAGIGTCSVVVGVSAITADVILVVGCGAMCCCTRFCVDCFATDTAGLGAIVADFGLWLLFLRLYLACFLACLDFLACLVFLVGFLVVLWLDLVFFWLVSLFA